MRALVLTLTMLGSSLLTVALKGILGRTRPSTDTLLGPPATTTSFPSGHSFNTAVFTGLLAGMVLLSTTAVVHRTLAIMAAAGATLLVGTSRVYLGYHWMTDVMAGMVPGTGLVVPGHTGDSVAAGTTAPASGSFQRSLGRIISDDLRSTRRRATIGLSAPADEAVRRQ